jgi:FeS assembly SUF system protein
MIATTSVLSPHETQNQIIQEFQFLGGDREAMLHYLMELGEKLPPFPATDKTEQNKIQGCMSTVWLSCKPAGDKLYFQADSNTAITKGLISLLIRVLSGQSIATILHTDLYFLDQIGMNQLIGSQRSSGLASMIQQIRKLATAQQALVPAPTIDSSMSSQEALKAQVIEAIKQVHDPEIPVNIYELGLIYEVSIYPVNNVHILMTLTSPNCPAAEFIPSQVETNIRAIEGVNEVQVEITFDPPYSTDRMSEAAKLELGFL